MAEIRTIEIIMVFVPALCYNIGIQERMEQ